MTGKVSLLPGKRLCTAAMALRAAYSGIEIKDYTHTHTYAPVSHPTTLRALFPLASTNNWRCDHMDVVTAFLHPEIDQKDIPMKLPELHDLVDLSEFGLTSKSRIVLLKALYGLKQSPRLWHQEINSFLKSFGFRQSTADQTSTLQPQQ